mmetsp:Transcript_20675/g.48781  ORF Transcript_20675/g.48781 Transcript_20675/m.48781 type:complete len:278 (-) Transcript_20675:370-1203(-)
MQDADLRLLVERNLGGCCWGAAHRKQLVHGRSLGAFRQHRLAHGLTGLVCRVAVREVAARHREDHRQRHPREAVQLLGLRHRRQAVEQLADAPALAGGRAEARHGVPGRGVDAAVRRPRVEAEGVPALGRDGQAVAAVSPDQAAGLAPARGRGLLREALGRRVKARVAVLKPPDPAGDHLSGRLQQLCRQRGRAVDRGHREERLAALRRRHRSQVNDDGHVSVLHQGVEVHGNCHAVAHEVAVLRLRIPRGGGLRRREHLAHLRRKDSHASARAAEG